MQFLQKLWRYNPLNTYIYNEMFPHAQFDGNVLLVPAKKKTPGHIRYSNVTKIKEFSKVPTLFVYLFLKDT